MLAVGKRETIDDLSRRLVESLRAPIVKKLHELGVLIAIDDYGTGFSSLGYLRDLRVHALKLDKSFVANLEQREQNRVIVESTLQMAARPMPADECANWTLRFNAAPQQRLAG